MFRTSGILSHTPAKELENTLKWFLDAYSYIPRMTQLPFSSSLKSSKLSKTLAFFLVNIWQQILDLPFVDCLLKIDNKNLQLWILSLSLCGVHVSPTTQELLS
jgi:hypothetical protein